jgi:hypothetical protein
MLGAFLPLWGGNGNPTSILRRLNGTKFGSGTDLAAVGFLCVGKLSHARDNIAEPIHFIDVPVHTMISRNFSGATIDDRTLGKNSLSTLAQPIEEFDSRHIGHLNIKQDEVDALRGIQKTQGLLACACNMDRVAPF